MNSYIFASRACKACDLQPFEPSERQVLRTSTQDICCTCGSVLQTFPSSSGQIASKDLITIPPAVSKILEELLKRRLFILAKGINPCRDVDHASKAIGHRAGDQVYIELRGPGNCTANLRWNYSSKGNLPLFPWEELHGYMDEQKGWSYKPSIELKPSLDQLEVPLPTRVRRACDVLSGMQFTGLLIDKRWREIKHVRFEQRVDLEEQLLDTTVDLCLVIKVELTWLQMGSTFPNESGPRNYSNSVYYLGYPQTVEEAVDAAIFQAMYRQSGENVTIHHQRDRLAVVASVGDPLRIHRQQTYYAQKPPKVPFNHQFSLTLRGGGADYFIGAFKTPCGCYLVPAGLPYALEISVPEPPDFRNNKKLPRVTVSVSYGDEVIAQQEFGGEDHKGGYSQCAYRLSYHLDPRKKLPTEEGKLAVIRVTFDGQTEERVYAFVSLKDYETAWDNWRNPIIDTYKRLILAEIARTDAAWESGGRFERVHFQSGQAVAAFVEGRWIEGTYAGAAENGVHTVDVLDRMGKTRWEVSSVKPLAAALTEGLHVAGPYNAQAPVGTHAKLVGTVSETNPAIESAQ